MKKLVILETSNLGTVIIKGLLASGLAFENIINTRHWV